MEFFLRFTADPEEDMERGHSLWLDPTMTERQADRAKEKGKAIIWHEEMGMYAQKHHGLSGHALEADTLEEALEEVRESEGTHDYYEDPAEEPWAIFAGEDARMHGDSQKYASTFEGDDFTPHETLHFEDNDGARS